jgi:hypothetical protein
VCKCALSVVPCDRGIASPFYRPGGAVYNRAAQFSYVWRYGARHHGVDDRPSESCFWQSVMACPVSVQVWLRGWRRGSLSSGRRACVSSRVGPTEGRRSHSGGRGDILLFWTPIAPGMGLQCPGWRHRADGDGGDTPHWFDVTTSSREGAIRASVPLSRVPPSSFEGAERGPYESGWRSVTELTLASPHSDVQWRGWPHREGWRNNSGI